MKRCWIVIAVAAVAARPGTQEPRLYNQGVTAYQSNDFTTATQTFEQALSSPDRLLQQRAYYNLGNTSYRLGETQPTQAQQLWQQAIKHFDSALALDPNDADAKFNREFVKKKLEELEKQQQQQKQDQNKQDKKQDQKKDDQQQQQQDQKQDQQQKENQQKKEEQEKQQQQQQQAKQDQQKKQQEQQAQAQQGQTNNVEKIQAAALLNDLRENERNWNFFPEVQMKDFKDKGEPGKDW